MILKREFYTRDSLIVAKDLLGKILIHQTPEGITTGKIVETEAYKGPEDKASHSYGNKRTPRTETMFGPKGHVYIYLIYGLYCCLNVTTGAILGKPEATLIRAIEPLKGTDLMIKRRGPTCQIRNIASGPGRLCIAMGLSKAQNTVDVCQPPFYIIDNNCVESENIVVAARIGVDYAEDWKDLPWRFYIKDNPFVSVKIK